MSEGWPEPIDEDSVRRTWTAPGFDLTTDARLGLGGYARVERLGDERVWIDLRGDPSPGLLDWAESRAGELGKRWFAGAWTTNGTTLDELSHRGFVVARYSQRMEIAFAGNLPEPVWPDGIAARAFRPGDERAFYEAQQEAFADTWEPVTETLEEWSHWLIGRATFDPGLWFLAERENEAAGFAICHVHRALPELGWVQLLGVRRPWRGLGLGRALLVHAFREFQRRGMERVGLGVDSESPTGAHLLYESVGMRETARFEIREKALA